MSDKYYCQNPGCENEIPEPQRCCNGQDCGCYGMPIEPPYCSPGCMKEHSIYKKLEAAHTKLKSKGILVIGAGAGQTVMAQAIKTAAETNTRLVIIDPKTSMIERSVADIMEDTVHLIKQLEANNVYVVEDKHPFQKFIGKPAHPYRRKK